MNPAPAQMGHYFKIGDWNVTLAPHVSHLRPLIQERFDRLCFPDHVLIDTPRSRILLYEDENHRWIIKDPIEKDQNVWQRIISPLRRGESMRAHCNSLALFQCTLPIAEPIAVFERRAHGILLESRLITAFIRGQKCADTYPDAMAHALGLLHRHGFTHGDPHIHNFLCYRSAFYILDLSGVRKTRNRFLRALDFALLEKSYPKINQRYLPQNQFYPIARTYLRMGVLFRERKRAFKRWLQNH